MRHFVFVVAVGLLRVISVIAGQVISGATRKVLLIVIILVTLIAVAYCGYNGLLWLSDWMNEAELQRQRRIYPRI